MSKLHKKEKRWQPAAPLKRPDGLVSSSQFNNVTPFKPTFEEEKVYHFSNPKRFYEQQQSNLYYLLSWEYGRMWFAERKDWQLKVYAPKESEIFRRQYVLKHLVLKPKIQVLPVIRVEKFSKAKACTENKNPLMDGKQKKNGK